MNHLFQTRKFFLIEGIVLILLGVFAILWPNLSSVAFELVIGSIFLLSGIAIASHLFRLKQMPRKAYGIFLSIIFILFGALLLFYPITGVITLTLLLGILLFLQGCTQIFMGTKTAKYPYGKGQILQGVIALILSILILSGWPKDATWALGLIVGINLLVMGIGILSFQKYHGK